MLFTGAIYLLFIFNERRKLRHLWRHSAVFNGHKTPINSSLMAIIYYWIPKFFKVISLNFQKNLKYQHFNIYFVIGLALLFRIFWYNCFIFIFLAFWHGLLNIWLLLVLMSVMKLITETAVCLSKLLNSISHFCLCYMYLEHLWCHLFFMVVCIVKAKFCYGYMTQKK